MALTQPFACHFCDLSTYRDKNSRNRVLETVRIAFFRQERFNPTDVWWVVDLPERIASTFDRNSLNWSVIFQKAQLFEAFSHLNRANRQAWVFQQRSRTKGIEAYVMPNIHDLSLPVEGQNFLGEIQSLT